MVVLRLDWLVGWNHPLHVELDDIIPGFVWSVSGVIIPAHPDAEDQQHWFWNLCAWCTTLTMRKVHPGWFQSGIIVWLRVVYHLTLCGILPGFILVVKGCLTGMHNSGIWSPTLLLERRCCPGLFSCDFRPFTGDGNLSEPLSEVSSVLFCDNLLFNELIISQLFNYFILFWIHTLRGNVYFVARLSRTMSGVRHWLSALKARWGYAVKGGCVIRVLERMCNVCVTGCLQYCKKVTSEKNVVFELFTDFIILIFFRF